MAHRLSAGQVLAWRQFFQAMGWWPDKPEQLIAHLASMFSVGTSNPVDLNSETLLFVTHLQDQVPRPKEMSIKAHHALWGKTVTRNATLGLIAGTDRHLLLVDEALKWMLLHPYSNFYRHRKSLWGDTGNLTLWGSGLVSMGGQPLLRLDQAGELHHFVFDEIQIDISIEVPREPGLLNAAFIALLLSTGDLGCWAWAGEENAKALERVGVATAIMRRLEEFCQEIIGETP